MKRFLCIFLSFVMVISICSCGTKESQAEISGSTTSSNADISNADMEQDSSSGIEVNSGIFNVTITIPSDFVDAEMTQDKLDEEAKNNNYQSAILNPDGSITYVMTKVQHQELMDEIRDSIDQGLEEMVTSGDYPSIVSIQANQDYSQYTVEIDGEEVGLLESLASLGLYIFSGMYHAFNGTTIENISVKYINQSTGELIQEANSKDIGQAES